MSKEHTKNTKSKTHDITGLYLSGSAAYKEAPVKTMSKEHTKNMKSKTLEITGLYFVRGCCIQSGYCQIRFFGDFKNKISFIFYNLDQLTVLH